MENRFITNAYAIEKLSCAEKLERRRGYVSERSRLMRISDFIDANSESIDMLGTQGGNLAGGIAAKAVNRYERQKRLESEHNRVKRCIKSITGVRDNEAVGEKQQLAYFAGNCAVQLAVKGGTQLVSGSMQSLAQSKAIRNYLDVLMCFSVEQLDGVEGRNVQFLLRGIINTLPLTIGERRRIMRDVEVNVDVDFHNLKPNFSSEASRELAYNLYKLCVNRFGTEDGALKPIEKYIYMLGLVSNSSGLRELLEQFGEQYSAESQNDFLVSKIAREMACETAKSHPDVINLSAALEASKQWSNYNLRLRMTSKQKTYLMTAGQTALEVLVAYHPELTSDSLGKLISLLDAEDKPLAVEAIEEKACESGAELDDVSEGVKKSEVIAETAKDIA